MSFILSIHTEDKNLLDFLELQTKKISEFEYSFSNLEHTIEIFSDYIYLKIKNDILKKLLLNNKEETRKKAFISFLSADTIQEWKREVSVILADLFYGNHIKELYIDGIIRFRFKSFKKSFENFLTEEFSYFLETLNDDGGIQSLINFMNDRKPTFEPIYIETKENGDILIKLKEEYLFIEQENDQENVVVQLIFFNPQNVYVIDEYKLLEKQTKIVLKQILTNKISFFKTKKELLETTNQ